MRRVHILTILIGVTLATARVPAQQPPHQMPAPQAASGMPSPELVTACVDAQQQVAALAAQIHSRLEDARQTNSPQQMRAALADLQVALAEIRSRAGQCSPLQAAVQPADSQAGHTMSAKPAAPSGAKPADPMAGMDHSKMPMGGAASKASGTTPSAKSEPKQTRDPVCGKPVDPANAPSTTYKGVTHYFCSAEDRLRFIRNPETYLKGGSGKQ